MEPIKNVRGAALAKIISISNQKGGVAKTTTAINLASCLAVLGYRTLLVDMDPQGSSGSGIGLRAGDDPSIYEALVHEQPLKDIIQPTLIKNLDIALSCQRLFGAEIELVSAFSRELKLKQGLEAVMDDYKFVIIDTPPALGLLTINALTASDSVFIPVQCEYYALEGITQLVNTIALIKKNLNPQLEVEGVALTMHDRRNNISHQVEEEIRNHFGEKVYTTVIPRNVKLSEAPSFGKPILLYEYNCSGSSSYLSLTFELLERNGFHDHGEIDRHQIASSLREPLAAN